MKASKSNDSEAFAFSGHRASFSGHFENAIKKAPGFIPRSFQFNEAPALTC